MKKASIVFITGSKSSLPFIDEAKKRGYKTIVIDNDPDCVGKEIADNFAVFSAADEENILDYLKVISDKFEIKGIITYSSLSFAMTSASRIAQEFNLPFYSKESVEITYDKGLLHQKMIGSGCNLPKTSNELSKELLSSKGFNFPIVLKLKSGIGSLGTSFIESNNDLMKALAHQDLSKFIIQEYIQGPLLHIDGYIQNGQVFFFALLEKGTKTENSVPLTKSFCKASEGFLNLKEYEGLLNSIIKFIYISGMDNNFFGADFIFDIKKQDFFLIEIGYLLDVKIDRLLYKAGINPYRIMLDIATGKKVKADLNSLKKNLKLEFIYPNKVGKFNHIYDEDILFEWENDSGEVSALPKSVSDVLGWGIYSTLLYEKIPIDKLNNIFNKFVNEDDR